MNRRTFLASIPLLTMGNPAWAQGVRTSDDFVRGIGDRLVAVVNSSESVSAKRTKLTSIIDGAVDVDGVALFCLGRFWRNATPEQQQRYTTLFHQVLVNNISSKLGEYRGVRFTMGRSQQRGETVVVSTVVERPNNTPTNVDWMISNLTGDPKIIDVIAEGTSLRLTQRSDYAAYLSKNNNNIDALINAMHQQVQEGR